MITLLYGIFCTWCDEFFSVQSNSGLVMITNFIALTVSVTLSQQIYLPYINKPKPVPIVHNVFVYGTLKRGEPNHYWLNNPENGLSKFVKRAITVAKYPLVVGQKYNTPFLLKNPGIGNILLRIITDQGHQFESHCVVGRLISS